MVSKKLKDWYRNLNQLSGKRLDILKNALGTFADTRASQSAASLAYYAFFSLFPLLLALIAGGSYFLNSQQVFQDVTQFVQKAIPVSTQLITENLQEVLDIRGTVGIISLLTLLWSASGVFTNLAYSINLAWPQASRRNFLEKRLVGLGMIAGLSGLLILSLALDWIINLAPFVNSASASIPGLSLWRFFSIFGSWLTIFLLFLVLYRWVPTPDVHWSATLWGALTTSIIWKLVTSGFNWYLRSGFGRYQLVYGSLGAIVALLFLIYIVSMITLFGAHLSAAIDLWIKDNNVEH
ncbi:MAG: YihY/virulence factor BrkB family protein [Anaerolineales bacterium]